VENNLIKNCSCYDYKKRIALCKRMYFRKRYTSIELAFIVSRNARLNDTAEEDTVVS
jgi:hypothetical protein